MILFQNPTMFWQCLSTVTQCLYGKAEDWTGGWEKEASDALLRPRVTPARQQQPTSKVVLDTASMGREAVVIKDCTRLCGNGAARASSLIMQDRAYWETRILLGGQWGAGLCDQDTDLNTDPGRDPGSWVVMVTSGGQVMVRGAEVYTMDKMEEGDVLGFSYDHEELNIFCNGEKLDISVQGIKGVVYPVFYVDEGAILECVFEKFQYQPPDGIERIMKEKALIKLGKAVNNNDHLFEI